MRKLKSQVNSLLLFTMISLLMSIVLAPVCYGNSAEPPSILIIVPGADNDLEISIGSGNTYAKANKTKKYMESYYTFYSQELKTAENYTLKVKTKDSTFELPIDKPLQAYNNIYTLDLANQTLKPGKLLTRSFLLVCLRLALTLLIEAIIFWLFGYRNKASWLAFLAINLITQGALNIWLNGFSPVGSYLILTLIFGEVLVFIVEMIAFALFVKEHRVWRTLLYVPVANFLSLVAGSYIIKILPV